tara:strand:- start:718 stop:1464 length:747 start_codon:yes stop_codon:yes gene_type:complete
LVPGSEEYYERIIDAERFGPGCIPTCLDQDRTCREAFEIDFPIATKEFGTFVAKELAIKAAEACAGGIVLGLTFKACGPVLTILVRTKDKLKQQIDLGKFKEFWRKLRKRKDPDSRELDRQLRERLKNIPQFDEFISPNPSGRSKCVPPSIKPLGRGSTANLSKGTTLPRNLRERLAVEQALSNPTAGKRLPLKLGDSRWPDRDGWVKMQLKVKCGGREGDGVINVHYVYNTITGQVDDFKIVLSGRR